MSILGTARRAVERLTGTHIYRSPPAGADLFFDIAHSLPHFRAQVVFDVGANLGQSARQYAKRFPGARIYSFEPASTTFRQLCDNVRDYPGVQCFRLALGSATGSGRLVLQGPSQMFFVSGQSRGVPAEGEAQTETIEVCTLDAFCATKEIVHIDFLKVDTEGADLDVLKGAERLLVGQQIDLVQVEAGMNPGNLRHVPVEQLKGFLEAHGYLLYHFYEQMHEWPMREPHLRRVDAVFMSREMIARHRISASS